MTNPFNLTELITLANRITDGSPIGTIPESLAWISQFDKSDLSNMLIELSTSDDPEGTAHEWHESALVYESGLLDTVFHQT